MSVIGKELRKIRDHKKWSREHLSLLSGVSMDTIINIELGRSGPRYSTVETLSDALEYEIVLTPKKAPENNHTS
jgi:transcriptional regulator with XRE-family HTH domain